MRKVQALHKYDCLRANKSTMAWGVEARVPFLDRHFLDIAMDIDPAEKMIDKANGKSLSEQCRCSALPCCAAAPVLLWLHEGKLVSKACAHVLNCRCRKLDDH